VYNQKGLHFTPYLDVVIWLRRGLDIWKKTKGEKTWTERAKVYGQKM
jgi:hypothetical protein